MSADLQRRPQFDVHAGHQVVLGQQQQSLAVDLLQPERLRHVTAAWNTSTRRHGDTVKEKKRHSLFELLLQNYILPL